MGIFSGKDVYSAKYTTADIQSTDRVWFVPIKYLIGNFFLTELDGLLYCFEMDGTRIKTHRHLGIKAFRKIYFDISHLKPIDSAKIKELEAIIKKNDLPNIDKNLLNMFKRLGEKEKNLKQNQEFTPHVIAEYVNEIGINQEKNMEEAENIKQFCENLGIEQIATPLKGIGEFLQKDLLTINPQYMGSLVKDNINLDILRKKLNNAPKTGKKNWMVMIALLAIVGLVIGVAIWAWQSGAIDSMIPKIGPGNPAVPTGQTALTAKYPTPESAKAAIDRGEVKLSDFPKAFQDMIKQAKPPALPENPIPAQH